MTNLFAAHQLDKKVNTYKSLSSEKNWLYTLRKTLNVPLDFLCDRMKLNNKSSIFEFEKKEREGKITIESLEKFGHALGLELVYGFKVKGKGGSFVDSIYNMAEIGLNSQFKDTFDLNTQRIHLYKLKQLESKKIPDRLKYRKALAKNKEERNILKNSLEKYNIELTKEEWKFFDLKTKEK